MSFVAIALVMTSAAVQADIRRPAALDDTVRPGAVGEFTVVATQTAIPDARYFRATLVGVEGLAFSVPVRVFDAAPDIRAGIGTTLSVQGRLVPTDHGDEVSYLLFAVAPAELVAELPWQLAWAETMRATFSGATELLPGDGGQLLPGLAIGDTSRVNDTLDSAMKSSSLSHLTAVSGANCAVVIGLIMIGGRAIGLRRGVRIAASLIVLAGFVVLVTPDPSVLRAALMAAIVLAALSSGRPLRGLPVLACAIILLLVFDPWLGRSYAFVLSVLATGGILLLAGPIARLLMRWLPVWAAAVISVPLAAQLACQPVLVLLDASLPLYGVIANVLAAPAAPLATVIGLVACVLLPLVPPLGQLAAWLAWLPSAWIAAVAHFFTGLPLARLPWPEGAGGAVLLAVITVLATALVLVPLGRTGRSALALALACVLVVSAVVAVAARITERLNRPGDWQYAVCDVGQGDAVLVRSAGRIALVDTGQAPVLLSRCLDSLGIGHIDLLVLSHFDLDHVGGITAILGRVDQVIVGPSAGEADDAIVRELVDAGARVQQVSQGATGILGELRWRVLWPPTKFPGIEPGNNTSLAMTFHAEPNCERTCASSLFLGDLGADAQSRMLALNPALGRVDVIKVGHHGSRDQDARVYERAAAMVALIGVGENTYGHPHPDILLVLSSTGATIGRTDLDGLVLVSPGDDARSLLLWRQHPDVAGGG